MDKLLKIRDVVAAVIGAIIAGIAMAQDIGVPVDTSELCADYADEAD